VNRYTPDVICLTCTVAAYLPAALQIVRALKAERPQLIVIADGAAAPGAASELLQAGCSRVCGNASEVRRAVRQYALNRSRTQPTDGRRFPILLKGRGTESKKAGNERKPWQ
jgi:methylmalonyl-CoA mutase cobalamin-binding subunit